MNAKRCLSLAAVCVLAAALAAVPAMAGEWHSGGNLICSDCHTAHFSMQHGFDGGAVATTPAENGNWLGTSGPNEFLLKAPANELCLSCHDGQSFAPDVLGTNSNISPSQGREAGALNEDILGSPYEHWKGHTLGSTDTPPGYDPTLVGTTDWYDPSTGLECTSCHAQHGPATSYRNLGPYAMGHTWAANARPTYVIGAANDPTVDVWINLASYTAGSGDPNIFNEYYDRANVSFNRNDATVGTTTTSNRMDTFCAACHGDFHGGPGDTEIGASTSAFDAFSRHPTSGLTIGEAAAQGYGGHSSLTRFQANTTPAKVYASAADYSDASPGCLSCHKAHGNQNPFGLVFLNGNADPVNEEGGYAPGQTEDPAHPYQQAYRNLCGQCHSMGN